MISEEDTESNSHLLGDKTGHVAGSMGHRSNTSRKTMVKHIMAAFGPKAFTLGSAIVALIAARTVDQTLYYRLNFSYSYFVWYLSTIILPVAFLIIFWPVTWYRIYKGIITPAQRRFPLYKFAIMGLFDCLFNIMATFPIHHLGGDLSNILSQSVLPINMLFASVFLRTVFLRNHYLGAFLVIYGIAIKLSDGRSWEGSIGWVALMILAQAPAAASNVYKQTGMKDANLDLWYANAWIATFQLYFGFFTFWTLYIGEFMAPHPSLTSSSSSFTNYLKTANMCFVGEVVRIDGMSRSDCEHNNDDAIVDGSYNSNTGECKIDCSDSDTVFPIFIFFFFIFFNVVYNQLMLYIFKYGSSVLFVVASAVRLPLVDALNSWKWVAGPAKEGYHTSDTFALIILVVAILVYYSESEQGPSDRGSETTLSTSSPSAMDRGSNQNSGKYHDHQEEEEEEVDENIDEELLHDDDWRKQMLQTTIQPHYSPPAVSTNPVDVYDDSRLSLSRISATNADKSLTSTFLADALHAVRESKTVKV